MSLDVKVMPILDSHAIDTSKFIDVKAYYGKIDNEVRPEPAKQFLGAWYRKCLSSKDFWLGFEGTITLGEFESDPERFNTDGSGRMMDNPSIYCGGNAYKESDCGLGWNTGYQSAIETDYEIGHATPKVAWRPFWRYIYSEAIDINCNVLRRECNSWNISDPRHFGYYYFPGDKVKMQVYSPIPNYLQMRITVIEPTKIDKYVKIRKGYNLLNDRPSNFISPIFHSKGHGTNIKKDFKRVNSIDQYGNEGLGAKNTKATVKGSVWHECYLYREINGELIKVPFNEDRYTSIISPSLDAFTLGDKSTNGGESIDIHPHKAVK